jgi:hypothetical protein
MTETGKGVKKTSATETTIFVYNADGTLAAEYLTDLPDGAKVSYLLADHLGIPRIITDESGTVISRYDYLAFGDEVTTTVYSILRLSLRVSEICRLKVSDIKKEGRWGIDYRSKGRRKERQPLPLDIKQLIDSYLESDRINRKDTKTGGENAYVFQADVSRRNLEQASR